MFSEENAKLGVTYPKGFTAAGIKAGIKKSGNLDLALIYTKKEAALAGTFTQNKVAAISRASFMPCSPVQALAQPALAMIA